MIYASPPMRWKRHVYVVMTGRSEWTRFLLARGFAGEHARWLASADRPDSMRRELWGVERLPGDFLTPPWKRLPAIPQMHFIEVGPLTQAAGFIFALWVFWAYVREAITLGSKRPTGGAT